LTCSTRADTVKVASDKEQVKRMTITLDIKPEVQAALARQAAAHGRPLESYIAALLEEAVHLPGLDVSDLVAKDMVELFTPLHGLNIDFERDRDPGRDIQP
jgi:hypothetical protein